MNLTPKQLTKKWIEALRSGEFNQTKWSLINKHRYCCLGVLCEISKEQFNLTTKNLGAFSEFVLRGRGYAGTLPPKMSEYIKLHRMPSPRKDVRDYEGVLIDMNDQGSSFPEIADYIEKEILPLQES